MEDSLVALMPRTVIVYSSATPSVYGVESFAASGTTYSARITKDPQVMLRVAGPVKDPVAVAWIDSTTAIGAGSRVRLPDGTSPRIASATTVDDDAGVHHVRIVFA